MRSLRTTRGCSTAVVAVCRESRDPLFLGAAPVHLRQGLAALRAAARCTKPVPALDAVAVSVVALVDFAVRQRQADWARERVVVHPRGPGLSVEGLKLGEEALRT